MPAKRKQSHDADAGDLWIDLGQERVPVEIRRNAKARRFVLRVDGAARKLVLTVPTRATVSDGMAFVEQKAVWARNRLALIPPPVPFDAGVEIPVLGSPHTIRHRPDARRGVWRDAGQIHVSGDIAFLPRRVEDWLRGEARRLIDERARAFASRVDRRVSRVSVRDTRSRWGSCSSSGNLNFSWRLVFAPETVLDYVVAHEVAHLVHMDHSDRFWGVVDRLVDNKEAARKWLNRHGAGLYRYGAR